ncbi:unnamed protein product [Candidula unifasciata]|uniref:PTHB1 C-terminal helix bundle domain-containing protein n=1 Tax=Candidula unifasciata TaxID=100452 RepID=A0A8S4A340_9EUPU|nr:unnamed protein product [Candidula unifasciata]
MTDEEVKILNSTLSPVVNSSDDQGWEESVDAAMTLLLRTVLAKSGKEGPVNPSPLTLPEDTSKVKKHIAMFCDRIGKGARLVDGLKAKKEKTVLMSTSQTNMDTSDQEVFPDQPAVDAVVNSRKTKKGRASKSFGLPQQDIQEPDSLSDILPSPYTGSISKEDIESRHRIESMVPDLDSMSEESRPSPRGDNHWSHGNKEEYEELVYDGQPSERKDYYRPHNPDEDVL